jgi:nickel/cobalt exporter
VQLRLFSLAMVAAVALGALVPGPASAHPSGTYTVDTYTAISLFRGAIEVRYIADYSEIPSLQWSIIHDTDGDGVISSSEIDAFITDARTSMAENLWLTVAGERVELLPVAGHATFSLGDLGVDTLRIEVTYRAAVEVDGLADVTFEDHNFLRVSGWRAITVIPGEGTTVDVTSNWLEDPSAALTILPGLWRAVPPKQRSVSFHWDPASGPALDSFGTASPPAESLADDAPAPGGVGRLVRGELGLGSVALALTIAFMLGMLDGFGPGHGKTVVGSYVAGRETRITDVVAIGGVAAATHALIAVSAGLLVLEASTLFLPDLVQWLSIGAGLTALSVGTFLVVRRVRGLRRKGGGCCEATPHVRARKSNAVIGVLGGLIPCPTAFILLLTAVSVGRLGFGVALAAVFSVGTAVALVAVGIGVVLARRESGPLGRVAPGLASAASYVPVASAGVMIVAGLIITRQALTGPVL